MTTKSTILPHSEIRPSYISNIYPRVSKIQSHYKPKSPKKDITYKMIDIPKIKGQTADKYNFKIESSRNKPKAYKKYNIYTEDKKLNDIPKTEESLRGKNRANHTLYISIFSKVKKNIEQNRKDIIGSNKYNNNNEYEVYEVKKNVVNKNRYENMVHKPYKERKVVTYVNTDRYSLQKERVVRIRPNFEKDYNINSFNEANKPPKHYRHNQNDIRKYAFDIINKKVEPKPSTQKSSNIIFKGDSYKKGNKMDLSKYNDKRSNIKSLNLEENYRSMIPLKDSIVKPMIQVHRSVQNFKNLKNENKNLVNKANNISKIHIYEFKGKNDTNNNIVSTPELIQVNKKYKVQQILDLRKFNPIKIPNKEKQLNYTITYTIPKIDIKKDEVVKDNDSRGGTIQMNLKKRPNSTKKSPAKQENKVGREYSSKTYICENPKKVDKLKNINILYKKPVEENEKGKIKLDELNLRKRYEKDAEIMKKTQNNSKNNNIVRRSYEMIPKNNEQNNNNIIMNQYKRKTNTAITSPSCQNLSQNISTKIMDKSNLTDTSDKNEKNNINLRNSEVEPRNNNNIYMSSYTKNEKKAETKPVNISNTNTFYSSYSRKKKVEEKKPEKEEEKKQEEKPKRNEIKIITNKIYIKKDSKKNDFIKNPNININTISVSSNLNPKKEIKKGIIENAEIIKKKEENLKKDIKLDKKEEKKEEKKYEKKEEKKEVKKEEKKEVIKDEKKEEKKEMIKEGKKEEKKEVKKEEKKDEKKEEIKEERKEVKKEEKKDEKKEVKKEEKKDEKKEEKKDEIKEDKPKNEQHFEIQIKKDEIKTNEIDDIGKLQNDEEEDDEIEEVEDEEEEDKNNNEKINIVTENNNLEMSTGKKIENKIKELENKLNQGLQGFSNFSEEKEKNEIIKGEKEDKAIPRILAQSNISDLTKKYLMDFNPEERTQLSDFSKEYISNILNNSSKAEKPKLSNITMEYLMNNENVPIEQNKDEINMEIKYDTKEENQ